MASANFTFDDAIQATRKMLNDDAQRRWSDLDILTLFIPRVYQQLKANRPDGFVGFGPLAAVNLKPSSSDPVPFADELFNEFVEGLLAAIQSQSSEAVSTAVAQAADARSERARQS